MGYETAKFAIDVTADVIILSKVKVVKNIIFVGGTAYTIVMIVKNMEEYMMNTEI